MKLELKHIVGYLPYDLKVIDFGMHENGFRQKHSVKKLTLTPSNLEIGLKDVDGINQKPILRPLSDLTKEIEINGEKFVPLIRLAKIAVNEYGTWEILENEFNVVANNFPYEFWYLNKSFYISKSGIDIETNNQLELFEKLYEWHFDIHNLIEKGLAIDKNTIL